MKDGLIFNIQKFCLNDGPGIRTTVFFKGCPLECSWCHNPESHLYECEILYDADKCIGCRRCATVCKNNAHIFEEGRHMYCREQCMRCGSCLKECFTNALEKVGRTMSVEEILQEVLKDKVFYDNSGGGLTISGGEPLMQFEFVYELLKQAKTHNIHTCIETCGFVNTEKICKITEYADIFLYDWKMTDDELHKKYTGVSNKLIEQNLYSIDKLKSRIILRCPIIPGVNDNREHFSGITGLANSLTNILSIEIVPYHSFGNSKYRKLNNKKSAVAFRLPSSKEIKHWIEEIQKLTTVPVKKA